MEKKIRVNKIKCRKCGNIILRPENGEFYDLKGIHLLPV